MTGDYFEDSEIGRAVDAKHAAEIKNGFLRATIRLAKLADDPANSEIIEHNRKRKDMVGDLFRLAERGVRGGKDDDEIVLTLNDLLEKNRKKYVQEADAAFSGAVDEDIAGGGDQILRVFRAAEEPFQKKAKKN